mgnify:CR=1 FL=1
MPATIIQRNKKRMKKVKVDTVTIAGTTWDLYVGRTSWNVYSFVRTSNTRSPSAASTAES